MHRYCKDSSRVLIGGDCLMPRLMNSLCTENPVHSHHDNIIMIGPASPPHKEGASR